MSARDPFDEADRLRVANYLARHGRVAFDPLADPATAESDPYFTPSIGSARRHMMAAFGARRPNGDVFRAYPVFIERPYANAFAADLGGLHLCAVDVGMVTILFELACYCFSQHGFFPDIGDPRGEASPALPQDATLGYWIMDRVAAALPTGAQGIGEELIPLDLDRRLMAHFLTQMMMRFVWLHELFHGLNGHSGLVASLSVDAVLREMPDDRDLSLVEIESAPTIVLPMQRVLHALEFDADRAAFALMVRLQMEGNEPFVVLAEKPVQTRLRLVTIATVLMTFLFDQSAKRHALATHATHPAPQLRLHNLVRTIASGLDDPSGELRAVMAHTLTDLDRLREGIPSLISSAQLLSDLRSTAFQSELDQVEADLEQVREILRPFAYH